MKRTDPRRVSQNISPKTVVPTDSLLATVQTATSNGVPLPFSKVDPRATLPSKPESDKQTSDSHTPGRFKSFKLPTAKASDTLPSGEAGKVQEETDTKACSPSPEVIAQYLDSSLAGFVDYYQKITARNAAQTRYSKLVTGDIPREGPLTPVQQRNQHLLAQQKQELEKHEAGIKESQSTLKQSILALANSMSSKRLPAEGGKSAESYKLAQEAAARDDTLRGLTQRAMAIADDAVSERNKLRAELAANEVKQQDLHNRMENLEAVVRSLQDKQKTTTSDVSDLRTEVLVARGFQSRISKLENHTGFDTRKPDSRGSSIDNASDSRPHHQPRPVDRQPTLMSVIGKLQSQISSVERSIAENEQALVPKLAQLQDHLQNMKSENNARFGPQIEQLAQGLNSLRHDTVDKLSSVSEKTDRHQTILEELKQKVANATDASIRNGVSVESLRSQFPVSVTEKLATYTKHLQIAQKKLLEHDGALVELDGVKLKIQSLDERIKKFDLQENSDTAPRLQSREASIPHQASPARPGVAALALNQVDKQVTDRIWAVVGDLDRKYMSCMKQITTVIQSHHGLESRLAHIDTAVIINGTLRKVEEKYPTLGFAQEIAQIKTKLAVLKAWQNIADRSIHALEESSMAATEETRGQIATVSARTQSNLELHNQESQDIRAMITAVEKKIEETDQRIVQEAQKEATGKGELFKNLQSERNNVMKQVNSLGNRLENIEAAQRDMIARREGESQNGQILEKKLQELVAEFQEKEAQLLSSVTDFQVEQAQKFDTFEEFFEDKLASLEALLISSGAASTAAPPEDSGLRIKGSHAIGGLQIRGAAANAAAATANAAHNTGSRRTLNNADESSNQSSGLDTLGTGSEGTDHASKRRRLQSHHDTASQQLLPSHSSPKTTPISHSGNGEGSVPRPSALSVGIPSPSRRVDKHLPHSASSPHSTPIPSPFESMPTSARRPPVYQAPSNATQSRNERERPSSALGIGNSHGTHPAEAEMSKKKRKHEEKARARIEQQWQGQQHQQRVANSQVQQAQRSFSSNVEKRGDNAN